MRYESKKSTEFTNVSLFESFSMEFLQHSENKLRFIELLNLDAYNLNMNRLFEGISPITQLYLIPWKLNHSSTEAFVVSINYSIVGEVYRTTLRVFQFDDEQEVAFQPYEQIEIEGKPARTFQGNDSVHLQVASPHSNQLISVLPENLLRERAIVQRSTFNKSCEFLLWEENSELLVYILESNPFIFYTEYNQSVRKIDVSSIVLQEGELATNPLKMSLVRELDSSYLIITYLALRKNSIALKYIQYRFAEEHWQLSKAGVLSNDIGVNPKEYLNLQRSSRAESYYSYHHRIYFIVMHRIYIIELDAATDKSIAIPLRDSYFFDKIVSYDHGNRLLLVRPRLTRNTVKSTPPKPPCCISSSSTPQAPSKKCCGRTSSASKTATTWRCRPTDTASCKHGFTQDTVHADRAGVPGRVHADGV